jgi:hypothetical protein
MNTMLNGFRDQISHKIMENKFESITLLSVFWHAATAGRKIFGIY